MNIKNKVAVVTGAAGGIGSALCRALSAAGAKVVVSDLDLASANAVAQDIGALAVQCDVSQPQSIDALIEKVEDELGDIDLFVSNAGFGVGEPDTAASAADAVWQKNWDVHVMAHVWAARNLLPKMIARGDGYLVNTASAAGLLNQIGDAAYSATKHAAVSFAESLAIAHNDQGIKVSVICPQYVNTNILAISDEQRKQDIEGVITPEDCANSVLAGIEAEQFMILPHAEVAGYYQNRANDPQRWVSGMRRYRAAMLDDNGKVDFNKIFGV
ncbi:SDR family oxidoreductase [Arenicella xantha]|nr:SDR family oxidoreductase [Arenicella xantha]